MRVRWLISKFEGKNKTTTIIRKGKRTFFLKKIPLNLQYPVLKRRLPSFYSSREIQLILRSLYRDDTRILKHSQPLHNQATHSLKKRFKIFRRTNNNRSVDWLHIALKCFDPYAQIKTSWSPTPIAEMPLQSNPMMLSIYETNVQLRN